VTRAGSIRIPRNIRELKRRITIAMGRSVKGAFRGNPDLAFQTTKHVHFRLDV
jgi:hypothetical protein